jgi:hypothetical protein
VNSASCHWCQNRRSDAVKVGQTVRHSAEGPCLPVNKLQKRGKTFIFMWNYELQSFKVLMDSIFLSSL